MLPCPLATQGDGRSRHGMATEGRRRVGAVDRRVAEVLYARTEQRVGKEGHAAAPSPVGPMQAKSGQGLTLCA